MNRIWLKALLKQLNIWKQLKVYSAEIVTFEIRIENRSENQEYREGFYFD